MKKDFLPFLFLISIVLVFFNKLFYPNLKLIYTPDFGSSDAFHFNYALKDFLSQSLKDNQLPLWSDNINSGFPLLAEGQIGTFNVFNLLLFKFLPSYLAFNLSIIIIFITLIIGHYLYLKSLKLTTLPSILGATAFSFSTYFVAKITHLNHIQAASFLPFILFFLEEYLKNPRVKYLIFTAFFFSQQIFSGYPMMVFITFLLISFRLIFFFWQKKFKTFKILFFLLPFTITAFLTLSLSAIQLFPQLQYLKASNLKLGFTFKQIVQYSYHFKNLLRFLNPFSIGNPTNGTYNSVKYGIFWETSSFLGTFPFLLAMFSLFLIKKAQIKYFFSLILISLLLSFGQSSPLYFIFTLFPFNLFRVPSRYLLIGVFAFSSLSALCLEEIRKRLKKNVFNIFCILVFFFTFYQLYSFFSSYHLLVTKDRLLKKPEAVTFLEKEKDFEKLYEYGGFISWSKYFKRNWSNISMFLFLKNNVQPNSSLIWQIPNEGAYFTQWPLRSLLYKNKVLGIKFYQETFPLGTLFTPSFFEKINIGLKIAGVSHFILPEEIENDSLKKVKKLQYQDEKVYLYKVKNPNPKFWIAKDYKLAKTVAELEKIVTSQDFDYQKSIILEKEINLSLNQENNPILKIIKDSHQQKLIKINQNKAPCLLVIGQSFYPGWQVFLDGKKIEVLAANLNQQAVIVPSGDHLINLVYKPETFSWGWKISITSLLILFVFLLLVANKNPQTLLLFVHHQNTQGRSFLKRPNQKYHSG